MTNEISYRFEGGSIEITEDDQFLLSPNGEPDVLYDSLGDLLEANPSLAAAEEVFFGPSE